jgi:casein kinase II subunit beta
MFFLAYPHLIPSKGGAVEGANSIGSSSTMLGPGNPMGPPGAVVAEKRRRREDDAMDGGLSAALGATDDVSTTTAALKAERYRPRIFGFQVHEIAKLQRWQEAVRDQ